MGVTYSPEYGIRKIHYTSGVVRGDIVKVGEQSYRCIGFDDYGCYVCKNLNPGCLHRDKVRTFDDLDISEVITKEKQAANDIGSGI